MTRSRNYDFTWYDKPHMEVTEGIEIQPLLDLWITRFGMRTTENEVGGDFFWEGATMRLLRAGIVQKQVQYERTGNPKHKIEFYVKADHGNL